MIRTERKSELKTNIEILAKTQKKRLMSAHLVLGFTELEEGHGAVRDDDGIGLLEHFFPKEFLDLVEDQVETKGVFLYCTKGVDRGLADFSGLDGGRREVLCGHNGKPVAILDEHLHDSGVYRTEDGLSDNGEIHTVCL